MADKENGNLNEQIRSNKVCEKLLLIRQTFYVIIFLSHFYLSSLQKLSLVLVSFSYSYLTNSLSPQACYFLYSALSATQLYWSEGIQFVSFPWV